MRTMKWCYVFVMLLLAFDKGTSGDNNLATRVYKEKTIRYYTKQNLIKIPIMIHLDKALIRNLSIEKRHKKREKYKFLARTILRDVEELFSRPNMNQKINFELLDLKIIKNITKKVIMDDNVSKYLRSYCEWQGERKIAKKRWFYSVLFTGLNLYYLDKNGVKIRNNTGRGYMNGVCSNKHSCTLLEWHPENIAYVLAHEIAHSLGLTHDGHPYNDCRGQRFIMDASYNPRRPAKIWSRCTKRSLNKFLKSEKAWCLREPTIYLYNKNNHH